MFQVVVLNTSQYLNLAYDHLINDNSTYQLLQTDPTQEIPRQYNDYLLGSKNEGVITYHQYSQLALPNRVETQTMYFLPKLHKDPLKIRPIVSATDGPTENASAFLDRLLQLYMKLAESYITNANDLVLILQNQKLRRGSYLVSLDIKSLHTNITHEEAIMTLLRKLKSHLLKVLLLHLLKYVLKTMYLNLMTSSSPKYMVSPWEPNWPQHWLPYTCI